MNIDEARKRATLNIEEAGKLLGLGRASAYAAAQRGEIPTRRFGRRVLVPVPALLALLGEAATHEG
ncbi:helix-turn-helix domain-containing protein [Clavibacter capsici]|uniref:helix-turn-helix domain-containing protein n=1 Tax=Clavibacter capsici TaxID=1874630 RepID=UPI0014284FFD|nr:helix-turn-helix domain-containing protein [Clavibacter capsici]QIS39075.1 helix-turn-helix domain-containing protein [Clavibacter capsici]